jgi:hypothetical protein
MSPYRWSVLCALPALIAAKPIHVSRSDAACASILSSLRPIPNLPATSKIKGEVDADLAMSCLQSIPLNTSAALDLMESLKPYLQFQTTLAFVKNPPAEYAEKVQAPYDFRGKLDEVSDKLRSGDYSSEYEVSNRKWLWKCKLTGIVWF